MKQIDQYLTYNPVTGDFHWIKSPNKKIKIGQKAGYLRPDGYRIIGFDGKLYLCHRLAYFMMEGAMPETEIDHINRNRDDNRWSNLRLATRQENTVNTKAFGQFPLKGAHYDKCRGKFKSAIRIDGKPKHLGYFETAEAAHLAYSEMAKAIHGNFASKK